MIFISKGGQDQYINAFAQGCGRQAINLDNFVYESSAEPLVLRGILKYKIIQRCWQEQRDFYYMDTGYFGNSGFKQWHRIVRNDLQHNELKMVPDDRWRRLGIKLNPRRPSGRSILLALPDDKPCRFYGINRQQWIDDTVKKIKSFTDRPIIVRERAAKRSDRQTNSFAQALQQDVYAVVTFNSIAAVESIVGGVPAFVLAPTHAAKPVASTDLSQIETPFYPDDDLRYRWVCHLAYGQFHTSELSNGTALKILKQYG